MHSSEREKDQSSSQCVSCKIHRTKHAKCCAEDKAPVAILQVGKFKFKPKKKEEDGWNPQTTFSQNCKFVQTKERKPCTALHH
jgi:hypothetical protein